MDVFDAIKNRRSIRAFEKKAIPATVVDRIIEASRLAPSAGNIQPWEFVVVQDPQIKHKLSVAALNQTFIETAPVNIVVCADEARSKKRYGSRGEALFCIQDTAAATQNLLLAAHALGLGTCWVGAFQENLVRKAINTPSHVRPVAIVPLGYASKHPNPRDRRSKVDIIHKETF